MRIEKNLPLRMRAPPPRTERAWLIRPTGKRCNVRSVTNPIQELAGPGVFRGQRRRTFEMFDRLVARAALQQEDGEVVVDLRVIGVDIESAPQVRFRLGVAAGRREEDARS